LFFVLYFGFLHCFCIVLCIVSPFVLFPIFVQVYRPLPPGGNPIVVINNIYHNKSKPSLILCNFIGSSHSVGARLVCCLALYLWMHLSSVMTVRPNSASLSCPQSYQSRRLNVNYCVCGPLSIVLSTSCTTFIEVKSCELFHGQSRYLCAFNGPLRQWSTVHYSKSCVGFWGCRWASCSRIVGDICVSFFFGRVRKIAKSYYLASPCLSACPSAWNNWVPTGRIFMKFDVWGFFENLPIKFTFR